jgi:hypothetical protein
LVPVEQVRFIAGNRADPDQPIIEPARNDPPPRWIECDVYWIVSV